MTKSEISAAIITKNSSHTIGKCLESIKLLTDDIVIVLNQEITDDTAAISKKYSNRVFTRKFDNFSGQRNYALSQTKNPWVLSIDADEWLSQDLQSEISALTPAVGVTAYSIPRKNIIFGKVINHTNWDPNGPVRLFAKSGSSWKGQVHEQITTSGSIGSLRSCIFHLNYTTVEEFLSRQDEYSSLEAAQKFASGQQFNLALSLFQPGYEFFRRFVWHAGFLDGWHGLYLSFLMSVYHISVWVKLWQKYHAA